MFENLSLSHPGLLWGLAAIAIPVLVHLLLRPRPRRLRFPALPLMRAALTSGRRAGRMRHVFLLMLRSSALALAVLLLAGPTCNPRKIGRADQGPVACAIILDNSLSLHYRPDFDEPRTLLDAALNLGLPLLTDGARWSPGSQFAVLAAHGDEIAPALSSDPATLARDLRGAGAEPMHARPLGAALRRAADWIAASPGLRPHIVVLTDGSAAAWRDVTPGHLSALREPRVDVLVSTVVGRANLALLAADVPAGLQPADAPIVIRVLLEAQGVPAQAWLVAREGEAVLERAGPYDLRAGERREVTLTLGPLPTGPHAVTLQLEPADLLAADQTRYVVWEAAPRPRAWLLAPPQRPADLTPLILANLLAPEGLAATQQRVALERRIPPPPGTESAGQDAPDRPVLVVVVAGTELADSESERLRRLLESGTTVLLVPGSDPTVCDWPALRALLGAAPPEPVDAPDGLQLRWQPTGDAVLEPDLLLELSRCRAVRRLLLPALAADTDTHATWTDGRPAIVGRTVGRGRLLLLGTSPDPSWSDLGIRAAGLLTWLHQLVERGQGAPAAAANFTAGEVTRQRFAALAPNARVRVIAPDGRERRMQLQDGIPVEPWPTEPAGLYLVRPERGGPAAQYAVNWPAEELDPTPVEQPELVRRLGTEHVRIEWGSGAAVAPIGVVGWFRSGLNGLGLLGLALVGFFIAELVVATRGRGRASELPGGGETKEPA